MFNINLSIKNPFSDRWDPNVFWRHGKLTENKSWEFQVMASATIINFGIAWYIRNDHAGPRLELGLLGYELELSIYDNRHWDHKNNRWETEEEALVAEQEYILIKEGTVKKNLNDPPTTPRPPAPKSQVAP